MFKSSERLRHEATQRSLDRVASTWRSSRTTWFDGTPESIDMRLAATDRLLTVARSGFTPAHLELTVEAENARKELLAAKHQLLNDFLDDSARAFKGNKRVADGRHDVDPVAPWKNTIHEDKYWDQLSTPDFADLYTEDGEPVGKHRAEEPSNFDKFVQSGELPSADAMRSDIARWTGKEGGLHEARAFKGSKRVAAVDPFDPESDEYTSDTGWKTFDIPGDSFNDRHDWMMKQLGRSPQEAQEARDAHYHEARAPQENENWEEGANYADYNGKCTRCKSDNIDSTSVSGEYDCYDCGATFHPKVRKLKSSLHTAGLDVAWEGKACPDCAMAIANGDDSGASDEWSWDKLKNGIAGLPGDKHPIIDCPDCEDGGHGFQRGPCDLCGSPYDGEFHRVVTLGHEGQ